MAAVAASSAVVTSAPASPAGPRLSPSSRTLHLGRPVKVNLSQSGPARFGPLLVQATTSAEEATTTTSTGTDATPPSVTERSTQINSTPTTPISTETISTPATGTSLQADELIADLKAKWDSIDNKTNVFIYGGGAVFALWLSATIVGAVNSVPLLPKVFELVGFGYSGWFVYRYLLFKEGRKELVSDFENLKAKITGTGKE